MDNYKITFETWNNIASIYHDRFMELDLYNDTYDAFCSLINKQEAKLLEIGCGPGNITKYLLSKKNDFKIDAIDVAPNMIEIAHQNNPTVNFKVMDARNIDAIQEKYNGIICGFCIPYLSKNDCIKLIKDFSFLLHKEGVVYFSFIEGDYESSGLETDSSGKNKAYVYYYQQDFFQNQLSENNFEILHVFQKEYTDSKNRSAVHLIFMAKKIN